MTSKIILPCHLNQRDFPLIPQIMNVVKTFLDSVHPPVRHLTPTSTLKTSQSRLPLALIDQLKTQPHITHCTCMSKSGTAYIAMAGVTFSDMHTAHSILNNKA